LKLIVGTIKDSHNQCTLENFLAALQSWDRELFASLQMELDPFSLIELLLAGATKILGVSDGSAKSRMGSFGWVISTPDGRRLVHCAGLAPGNKTSMLSMTRFFFHLFAFCGKYAFPAYICRQTTKDS
jgi:hypothetical protein